jgi:trans-aconitate 2-methyltransferase
LARGYMTFEWDAAEYEALAGPMTRWGADFLKFLVERRAIRGDEDVIDAGCGTGRVTELLLQCVPDGTVLAVDASEAMVEATAGRFARDPRVRIERRDLLRLEVERPVDLVFSTATLHWIKDHEHLFKRFARTLKPGGRLVAQCGGEGNISRLRTALGQVMREDRFEGFFVRWKDPWNFADPATTRARLEAAGFEEIETWLHEEAAEFLSIEELIGYLKTAVLGQHLTFLPEAEHEPFAAAVAMQLAAGGPLVIEYVRLNILATKVLATKVPDTFGGEVDVLRVNKAEERA